MAMSDWLVKDTDRGATREVKSRSEAEEVADDLRGIVKQSGGDPDAIEIVAPDAAENSAVDAREPEVMADGAEATTDTDAPTAAPDAPEEDFGDALAQLGESLETDPLSILPGHMIDSIQGQPAVNKRGYAMIAERYGVSVKSYIESYPWENEEGRCVARAVAITEEGKEYQDYATASDDDGDMPEQLIELASTRALKRVAGWATGLGIVSYQELSGQLEDER